MHNHSNYARLSLLRTIKLQLLCSCPAACSSSDADSDSMRWKNKFALFAWFAAFVSRFTFSRRRHSVSMSSLSASSFSSSSSSSSSSCHVPQPARFLSKIISYLLTSIELLQWQLQLQQETAQRRWGRVSSWAAFMNSKMWQQWRCASNGDFTAN